jgi:hypothetical protein
MPKRKAYGSLGADWEVYQRVGMSGAGAPGAASGVHSPPSVRVVAASATVPHGIGRGGVASDFFRASSARRPAQAATRAGAEQSTTMGGDFGDIWAAWASTWRSAPTVEARSARRSPRQHATADVDVTLEEAFAGTSRLVDIEASGSK